MTSFDNININSYSNYGNANAVPSMANFNNNSNYTGRDSGYFQGYQGVNTDGFAGGYGLHQSVPASTSSQQPLNDMTALARIQNISNELDQQSTGQTDGTIALGDLKQALEDKSGKYSKEDKEAIQYLMDNQNGMRGRLDSFDGKADAMMTVDSINKLVANPNAQPEKEKTPEQKMTNTEAMRIYKDYLGSHMMKGMDREKLSRMAESDKVSEEERTAFKKLLNNKELFDAADTGRDKNDHYDGHISIQDADKLLNRSDLDQIGVSGNKGNSGSTGQPVIQTGMSSYPLVSTGNPNLDYYYNNIFGSAVGPAADAYRQAPGGQQKAA